MNTIDEYLWKENFSLGVDNIDQDHKKLLQIYNSLVNIIKKDKGRKDFATDLIDMFEYSQSHFEREELYMLKLGFPFIDQHKVKHREYLKKVSLFNADLLSTQPPEPKEVLDFLLKWWSYHIPNCDKKYEVYKSTINTDVCY